MTVCSRFPKTPVLGCSGLPIPSELNFIAYHFLKRRPVSDCCQRKAIWALANGQLKGQEKTNSRAQLHHVLIKCQLQKVCTIWPYKHSLDPHHAKEIMYMPNYVALEYSHSISKSTKGSKKIKKESETDMCYNRAS